MTGTGGSRTGSGGAGGTGRRTGGSGGSVSSVCDTLVAEYQSAVTAAETCQVGASGQCQQLVTGSLERLLLPDLRHGQLGALRDRGCLAGGRLRGAGAALRALLPGARSTPLASRPTAAAPASVRTRRAPAEPAGHGRDQRRWHGRTTGPAARRWTAASALRDARLRVRGGVDRRQQLHRRCGRPVRAAGQRVTLALRLGLHEVRDRHAASSTPSGRSGTRPAAETWRSLCPAIACLPAAGGSCVSSDAGGSVCSTSYGTFGAD